jgi:hypothetical protein
VRARNADWKRRLLCQESRNSAFLSKKIGHLMSVSRAPDFKQIRQLLLSEEYVAIRSRTIAFGRSSRVGHARDGGKQGDGGDQTVNDAFHGDTPQLGVGFATRDDRFDG